ncbi:MAG: glycoside hydrolase [Chitinophagaceae bacterium]|nr:glycoside hydrolase [Chitinophagaceae bacterium]
MKLKAFFLPLIVLQTLFSFAQSIDSRYFNSMQWRMIGPHRGGRTVGAVGVSSQPNVFYIGVNNGGVWKTNDFGRTWNPIFDSQPTGSIGDVVVSPSNPDVLYVGSGEGLQRPDLSVGDGIYKSTDGGKTWSNTGLRDGQQVGGLAIDPKNENRVFAAVLGHPYGANPERGVYRTLDGGKTWERVLYKDENTGAIQVTIDPNNSNIIYADLWAGRLAPWENGTWNGNESGLFKSTDGGNTWKKLTKGLPTTEQGLGRIGFCIAPSNSNRLYATVDAGKYGGIYRSDDAGESWILANPDERLWGRGSDFAEVKADPLNADIVYTADVVVWKSTDGGKKWEAFRGAPGGDDYHRIWINPVNPKIILLASDQGAIITVNGGETFSSWYNQPTAQFYHVSTDNAFPYNVYSGQQESGSVGIASRGNDGQITYREWHPVAAEEYGYVAADPLNPNFIYGGKISRYDKRNGQSQNISPEALRSGKYRFLRTAPVLFNPIDNKTLYFAGNVLFKTLNGGEKWEAISPDLSRESWDIPANIGIYAREDLKKMPRRGVIYTVAPSYVDINTIWCGTDDGLIHVTRDGGKTWTNVTPPAVTSWSKVSLMDASHFDANTAYAAVNCIRLDDQRPHIYKTTDGGKTWTEITNGLPNDPINVVKEDPKIRGLLFAGSERAVHVSFDDGANWQSLRLNMPATSIRDLVIKDDDLVIGTHGRSFWILDDITPLRQINKIPAGSPAILYKPQNAYRVRWSMYPDTPLPQEEPAGQNPPDGAIINYYLDKKANELSLEILDENGTLIRKYTNRDTLYTIPDVNIPLYWIRPQEILSAGPGSHRFLWDMHYNPLNIPPSYPISATYRNTAPNETAPWVLPGRFIARLTVDGKAYNQSFEVKMDPRVLTSDEELEAIRNLAYICYDGRKRCMDILAQIKTYRNKIKELGAKASNNLAAKLKETDEHLDLLENSRPGNPDRGFKRMNNDLATLFNIINESDLRMTSQTTDAAVKAKMDLELLLIKWNEVSRKEIPELNQLLKKEKLGEL